MPKPIAAYVNAPTSNGAYGMRSTASASVTRHSRLRSAGETSRIAQCKKCELRPKRDEERGLEGPRAPVGGWRQEPQHGIRPAGRMVAERHESAGHFDDLRQSTVLYRRRLGRSRRGQGIQGHQSRDGDGRRRHLHGRRKGRGPRRRRGAARLRRLLAHHPGGAARAARARAGRLQGPLR